MMSRFAVKGVLKAVAWPRSNFPGQDSVDAAVRAGGLL